MPRDIVLDEKAKMRFLEFEVELKYNDDLMDAIQRYEKISERKDPVSVYELKRAGTADEGNSEFCKAEKLAMEALGQVLLSVDERQKPEADRYALIDDRLQKDVFFERKTALQKAEEAHLDQGRYTKDLDLKSDYFRPHKRIEAAAFMVEALDQEKLIFNDWRYEDETFNKKAEVSEKLLDHLASERVARGQEIYAKQVSLAEIEKEHEKKSNEMDQYIKELEKEQNDNFIRKQKTAGEEDLENRFRFEQVASKYDGGKAVGVPSDFDTLDMGIFEKSAVSFWDEYVHAAGRNIDGANIDQVKSRFKELEMSAKKIEFHAQSILENVLLTEKERKTYSMDRRAKLVSSRIPNLKIDGEYLSENCEFDLRNKEYRALAKVEAATRIAEITTTNDVRLGAGLDLDLDRMDEYKEHYKMVTGNDYSGSAFVTVEREVSKKPFVSKDFTTIREKLESNHRTRLGFNVKNSDQYQAVIDTLKDIEDAKDQIEDPTGKRMLDLYEKLDHVCDEYKKGKGDHRMTNSGNERLALVNTAKALVGREIESTKEVVHKFEQAEKDKLISAKVRIRENNFLKPEKTPLVHEPVNHEKQKEAPKKENGRSL